MAYSCSRRILGRIPLTIPQPILFLSSSSVVLRTLIFVTISSWPSRTTFPPSTMAPFASALLQNWSVDARITGHSALPFDVIGGTIFDSAGKQEQLRANLTPGQPLYVNDPAAPGGRRVNFNAFTTPTAAQQAAGQFGDAARNLLRGFPAWQLDTALRRQFRWENV
jgi:hypothetical protein